MRPGTTFVYTATKDGKPTRDVYRVTRQTRTIAGVPCVVVEDRLDEAGHLAERVRGVGEVLETSIKGPKERAALVDIRHG